MYGVCTSSFCDREQTADIAAVSLCMFLFGFVTICQGLVSSWGGLMTTRWFLGIYPITYIFAT